MKSNGPSVEVFGCFLMLILGAFLHLGVIALLPTVVANPAVGTRFFLTWIAAPAAGIALIAWGLCRLRRPRG
jgi:hypothetical protein